MSRQWLCFILCCVWQRHLLFCCTEIVRRYLKGSPFLRGPPIFEGATGGLGGHRWPLTNKDIPIYTYIYIYMPMYVCSNLYRFVTYTSSMYCMYSFYACVQTYLSECSISSFLDCIMIPQLMVELLAYGIEATTGHKCLTLSMDAIYISAIFRRILAFL